ncbi:hypothetical protein QBC40DRAFT_16425 [Triangularia verruculosa]|uniref:Uncharacterized protein n=1 Tax=Triangularia verruculosa TaxID=2587418 RepID=A0AAN6XS87_9PEZI|nr:hypothetical protein QBC40DRAFT_16425 [Triangularia verruculosa]
MTNHDQGAGGAGPSLFQARRTRHDHAHNHSPIINHHTHNQHRRLHREFSQSLENPEVQQPHVPETHARSPSDAKLHARQVVVIQTVSVVQYVDATGALVSLSTLRSDPVAPSPIDNVPAAVTAGLTTPDDLLPSVSLPDLTVDPSQDGTPTPTSPAVTEPEFSSSFQSTSVETLTSTPSGITPPFPILSSGNFNSSSTRLPPTLFTNSTTGLFHNSTRTSTSFFRSTTSSSFTKSSTSSRTRLTSTTSIAPTVVINGFGGDAGVAGIPAPEPTSEDSSPAPGPGLTPEARNAVVGGVVGSVAGIALVALVLMFFLKWRKQQGRGILLLGDGDSTIRGRGLGPGPSSGPSGGAGRMSQLRFPFAAPSALAKLRGNRAIEAPPAEPEEKGFYRVSGRKLVSVLESGGDGYSDPDPHTSVGTSYYRDSQAFLDSSNLPPLQLGSPMRPESGVIVYHDGPARTAVEERGPSHPGQRRSAFPNLLQVQDPVGRSINIQHAGSRVSQSRFTEDS